MAVFKPNIANGRAKPPALAAHPAWQISMVCHTITHRTWYNGFSTTKHVCHIINFLFMGCAWFRSSPEAVLVILSLMGGPRHATTNSSLACNGC